MPRRWTAIHAKPNPVEIIVRNRKSFPVLLRGDPPVHKKSEERQCDSHAKTVTTVKRAKTTHDSDASIPTKRQTIEECTIEHLKSSIEELRES